MNLTRVNLRNNQGLVIVEKIPTEDAFNLLPNEIMVQIFTHGLNHYDLNHIRLVNRRTCQLIHHQSSLKKILAHQRNARAIANVRKKFIF